jgi:hypothetical protein
MRDWLTEEEEEAERAREPALRLELFVVAFGMIAVAFFVLRTLL